MKKITLLAIALLGFFTTFTSCSSDEENTSRLAVYLVDAPGDYDEVNIDVIDVLISGNNGWKSLEGVVPQVYDLLKLTGGVDALLVDTEIPSGKINQIRLVLGENNSIVKNGQTFDIKTPSAQQSGLKLNVHQDLVAGVAYNFTLDFMVDKSIVTTGNGSYSLKPTIKISTEALSGAISGMVSPSDFQVNVTAASANDTISAYTNTEGKFLLHGVPQGTHKVTFTPEEAANLNEKIIEDVSVVVGETTDLGTVTLE